MKTTSLHSLNIHKLTQAQYDQAKLTDSLDENAIYLTPQEAHYTEDEVNQLLQTKADLEHTHDDRYYTEDEIDSKIVTLDTSISEKSDKDHDHNDTYYTETEIDSKLAEISSSIAGKSDTNHEHDDKYYTEDEIDSKIDTLNTAISSKADSTHQHTGITDGDNSAIMQDYALLPMVGNGVLTTASSPTTSDTPEINLGSRGNTWGTAYVNEVYIKNAGDYLTEILKSKTSDSAITSSIYSHNSSTSAHSDIRSLIDGLTSRLNALADSDDTTLDQLSEIVEYIKSNRTLIESVTTNKLNISDVIDNLTTNVSNKALSANQGVAIKALVDALQSEFDGHTHAISEVTGLQSALDSKAASSHGTHVTYSTTAPVMDGTASTGSASTVARSDHKHPTDTTRAAKTDLDSHTSNATVHITSAERTNWNSAKTHLDAISNPIITASEDGATYTATVNGITELTVGANFMMIPNVVSTSTQPTLNVNGLGAKYIRRRLSSNTGTVVVATTANWIAVNKPIRVTYDGTYWVVEMERPDATDLYGTVPISSGGTGATTAEAARTNLGLSTETWTFTLENGSTVTKEVCVG